MDSSSDLCRLLSLPRTRYELLTAELPFRGSTRMLLKHVIEDEAPSLRSRVPRDIETICLKCLENSPDRRYAEVKELSAELNRYLRDEPILARPVTRLVRTLRWRRRKPLVAGLTLAFTLSLILGTVFSTYFGLEANEQAEQAGHRDKKVFAMKLELACD